MDSVQAVIAAWERPGPFFLVCDPALSAAFWARIRSNRPYHFLAVPTNAAEYALWSGQLQQSFLGESILFWCALGAVGTKPNKGVQRVIDFLKTYQGPHTLVIHGDAEQAVQWGLAQRGVVDARVPMTALGAIAPLFGFERSTKVVDLLPHFSSKTLITLDEAVHFLWHAGYVPLRQPEASAAFLGRLLPQEVSLSQLSELFLKKDWPAFLRVWQELEPFYGEVFWISFFSEQLWRAYWVCTYLRRGQQTKARSIGYRLPAGFMQGGWRFMRLEALFEAYECAAFFDSRFKRGAIAGVHELVTALIGLL